MHCKNCDQCNDVILVAEKNPYLIEQAVLENILNNTLPKRSIFYVFYMYLNRMKVEKDHSRSNRVGLRWRSFRQCRINGLLGNNLIAHCVFIAWESDIVCL